MPSADTMPSTTHLDLSPKPTTPTQPLKTLRPLAPTYDPLTPRTKLANLLMTRSISFVHALNTRNVSQPWQNHATPDFLHKYTTPSGAIINMSAAETIQFFYEKFKEFPGYKFEILDTTVQLEDGERPSYGTVWQTCRVVDGETYGEKERVAIYSWRRETDRLGVETWRWWRQECPATAAVLPF